MTTSSRPSRTRGIPLGAGDRRGRGAEVPLTVHFHLKHLEELGVIGKQAGKGRALTLTEAPQENQVPIVGNVAAGPPFWPRSASRIT